MAKRDPTEPAATAVSLVATFWVLGMLLLLGAVLTGDGSAFGLGRHAVCADVGNGAVQPEGPFVALIAREGVTASPMTTHVCADEPTAGQRLLTAGTQVPSALLLTIGLWLALRLVRAARRDGLFTRVAAGRLRVLGWVVLAGGLAASGAEALARHALVATLLDPTPGGVSLHWQPPSPGVLLLGVALVTVARLVVLGTDMRRDLDLTV